MSITAGAVGGNGSGGEVFQLVEDHWEQARKPELIAIAVGAFADPSFPAPSQGVFEELRHRWVRLAMEQH